MILICLCSLLSVTVWANSPPSAERETYDSGLLHYLCFVLLSLCITVLVEWGIARAFHLGHSRLVIITNIVSQIVMQMLAHLLSLVFFILFLGVPSTFVIVFVEVFVLIAEWGYYCMVIDDISYGRLFAFSLCANAASLVAGLLLMPITFLF